MHLKPCPGIQIARSIWSVLDHSPHAQLFLGQRCHCVGLRLFPCCLNGGSWYPGENLKGPLTHHHAHEDKGAISLLHGAKQTTNDSIIGLIGESSFKKTILMFPVPHQLVQMFQSLCAGHGSPQDPKVPHDVWEPPELLEAVMGGFAGMAVSPHLSGDTPQIGVLICLQAASGKRCPVQVGQSRELSGALGQQENARPQSTFCFLVPVLLAQLLKINMSISHREKHD